MAASLMQGNLRCKPDIPKLQAADEIIQNITSLNLRTSRTQFKSMLSALIDQVLFAFNFVLCELQSELINTNDPRQ